MTVNLFNNQLILEVPATIDYISFKRMDEISAFCWQFPYAHSFMLTDSNSTYFSLSVENPKWYTTDGALDSDHYDATDQLLQLIQQPQTYEYW